MSVSRNTRLAWLSQRLSEGKTNAQIVLDALQKFPGVSEKTIRSELKKMLERLTDIEMENLPLVKQRMLEIGFKLMEEARDHSQYGPAVAQFKTLAILTGAIDPKGDSPGSAGSSGSGVGGVPEASTVRDRINKLMQNKKVLAEAQAAGIDLDQLKKDA